MSQLKTPTNFTVIRSEDRESVLFSWDAVTEDIHGQTGTADSYNIYSSELNNSLGFSVLINVPDTHLCSRQYAAVSALDPDLLYNFKMTVVNTDAVESVATGETTDF
jgi:hypothetical protein